MTQPFDPDQGLVVVQSELFGPSGSIVLRLAVDTGATSTLLNVAPLEIVGYDPSSSSKRIRIATGSGEEEVPRVRVKRIKAMGQERSSFPVLAHTLPPNTSVDGLLGLDYMRAHELRIDFRRSTVSLT